MVQNRSVAIYLTSMTIGGAERVALNLCKGLVNEGYSVELVLVDAKGELLDEVPDEVSIVDLGASRVMLSVLPLKGYLYSRKPDVLYSMMTEPNVAAVLAHTTASVDTRLILSEHNMLSRSSETLKDQIARAGAWLLYPYADLVVAVSKGVRDDLLANTRLNSNDIEVVYNPVDIEWIREQSKKSVNHKFFNDNSLEVVLAGGRHEPQKGFDTLLQAFARIEHDDVRLVLFGTGPETELLHEQAENLGIDDAVSFVGFVENPFAYMKSAEMFVLSSRYEGFGIVLIEALACGCPVVSTDCESGPAEILCAGKYGPLVPVDDDEALASAMLETICDSPNKTELQERANRFDIPRIVSEYDSVFYPNGKNTYFHT